MADYAESEKTKFYLHGMSAMTEYLLITLTDGGFVTNAEDFSKYLRAVMRCLILGEDNITTAKSYAEMMGRGAGLFWVTFGGEDEEDYDIGHDATHNLRKRALFTFPTQMDEDDMYTAVKRMKEFSLENNALPPSETKF